MTTEHEVVYGGYRCGECGQRIVLQHAPTDDDPTRAKWVHDDRPA